LSTTTEAPAAAPAHYRVSGVIVVRIIQFAEGRDPEIRIL
jgi:hypothetical protein